MLDNEQLCSGTALVYRTAGIYVPQQVSYLSVTDSQESPMNKQQMAIASLALEALHSDSSNSLPSGNRSSRRLREFIPEHKKDGDYWLKRQKNNEAAKRSREKRRVNDVIMGQRIMELTNENKRLRMELDAIRRTYGSPPPRQLPPQPPPHPPSAGMPYDAEVGYCIGGNAHQRRGLLPSSGCVTVSTSNAITSVSCSSFAYNMPVDPPSRTLCSFGETLPGGLGRPLSFDEREDLIGSSTGPTRSTCMMYPYEDERLRQKQMKAVIPVGYGNEGSRTLSLANPTSLTSSSIDCAVAFPPLDHLTSRAGAAGNQVNMPLLVRHENCLRTKLNESHLDTGMRQGNAISGLAIPNSQASRRHRFELPLLFSDVSSSDDNDDDILGDLYQLRSSEESPLNLSTRSGSSPVTDGHALPVGHRNTGFFSEYQGTAAVKSRTMPVLENLEQVTSAFNLPTSFSSHHNYNRNVLESLSKVELHSPEVPRLSSSCLQSSKDKVPEQKGGLPEALAREILSTTSFADSFLEGSSCLLKFPFGASWQSLDAPVREICDEEDVAGLGEQVISDTELYTLLRSDLEETPTKAGKDTGQVLSRPVRGGVPLKLWHKWSSSFSEEIKAAMKGRERDDDGPIHFQE